jgi:hypothetical protein
MVSSTIPPDDHIARVAVLEQIAGTLDWRFARIETKA